MDGVDQFDAEFFGYFPTEAQRLDPQQRLLLEVTHEAMEDAGLRRDQLDGSKTSVFIGSFMYDYLACRRPANTRTRSTLMSPWEPPSRLSNRISYDYNLKGPEPVAGYGLFQLAGGDASGVPKFVGQGSGHGDCRRRQRHAPPGIVDPDVAGRFLDPRSILQGIRRRRQRVCSQRRGGRGHHQAVKPGARRRRCGLCRDPRQCGQPGRLSAGGIHGPERFRADRFARDRLCRRRASIRVRSVSSRRMARARRLAIPSNARRSAPCWDKIARRKVPACSAPSKPTSAIWKAPSGITGFIKAVLTAFHGVVPPNLHFHQPNPTIDFDGLKLEVPTQPTPLERNGHALTVGVNSFGAGGTNAHIVLQECPIRDGRDSRLGGSLALPTDRHYREGDAPAEPWSDTIFRDSRLGGSLALRGRRLYMLSAANRDVCGLRANMPISSAQPRIAWTTSRSRHSRGEANIPKCWLSSVILRKPWRIGCETLANGQVRSRHPLDENRSQDDAQGRLHVFRPGGPMDRHGPDN